MRARRPPSFSLLPASSSPAAATHFWLCGARAGAAAPSSPSSASALRVGERMKQKRQHALLTRPAPHVSVSAPCADRRAAPYARCVWPTSAPGLPRSPLPSPAPSAPHRLFSSFSGHGTYLDDGKLVAAVAGVVDFINKVVSVRPVRTR